MPFAEVVQGGLMCTVSRIRIVRFPRTLFPASQLVFRRSLKHPHHRAHPQDTDAQRPTVRR